MRARCGDPIEESGLFEHGGARLASSHVQEVDRETLVDLVLSRSYCAVLTDEERAPVLDRVERLFDEHARSTACSSCRT